jgi:hypothetical protein
MQQFNVGEKRRQYTHQCWASRSMMLTCNAANIMDLPQFQIIEINDRFWY